MSIDDVKRVWKGGDDSATQFMISTCNDTLKEKMRKSCDTVLDSNRVLYYYEMIIEKIKEVPVVGELAAKYDIRDYTLQKALDGLYLIMKEQEALIRTDPKQRCTELLSTVFGFGDASCKRKNVEEDEDRLKKKSKN